jgi:hypothetical protein
MRVDIVAAAATAALLYLPAAAQQAGSTEAGAIPGPADPLGAELHRIRMKVHQRLGEFKIQSGTGLDRERRKVIVQVADPKAVAKVLEPLGFNRRLIFEQRTAFPRPMPAPPR